MSHIEFGEWQRVDSARYTVESEAVLHTPDDMVTLVLSARYDDNTNMWWWRIDTEDAHEHGDGPQHADGCEDLETAKAAARDSAQHWFERRFAVTGADGMSMGEALDILIEAAAEHCAESTAAGVTTRPHVSRLRSAIGVARRERMRQPTDR